MKKGLAIGVGAIFLFLGIGNSIIHSLNQPVLIWHCDGGYTGSETLEIPPPGNIFRTSYKISISQSFSTYGDYENGSITFTHISTTTVFRFSYDLGHSPWIGTESNSTVWNLPPGSYLVNWSNSKADPNYYLANFGIITHLWFMLSLSSGLLLSGVFCVAYELWKLLEDFLTV